MVGSQVTAAVRRRAPDNVYFLFPLKEQQDTMALVTGVLRLTAGVLMLLLVAGVSWLVTRQVVTPVRMAGQVNGWPPAGSRSGCGSPVRTTWPGSRRRSTRWPANLQRQIRQLEETEPRAASVRL